MSILLTMIDHVVQECHHLKEQTRVALVASNARAILLMDACSFQ
jgi:hypothetical protein